MQQNGPYYPRNMRTISLTALRKTPAGPASCYDLARDLAGAIKGLPEDLADNPKYMEGFGRMARFSPWTPIFASTGGMGTK